MAAAVPAADPDRAARVAREITDPWQRTKSLRDAANRLLDDSGKPPNIAEARRLIAKLLDTMLWWKEIGLVDRLDARALQAVCEALLAGTSSGGH